MERTIKTMALDGIVIKNIVSELEKTLTGSRVDRIYQPERDELTIVFPEGRLTVSVNPSSARVCMSTAKKENPQQAPMFCMLLRKHLTPARLERVYQDGFERIIIMEFDARNDMGDSVKKKLICELMGRHSNIILTDENGRIIDSIKHIDVSVSSVRQILPGLMYEGAPTQHKQNPLTADKEDIENALLGFDKYTPSDKALLDAFTGLSPMACREIVYRSCGSCDTPVSEAKNLSKTAKEFFDEIKACNFMPCTVYTNGKKTEFSSFIPKQYGNSAQIEPAHSVSEVLEGFYEGRDAEARQKQKTAAVSKLVSNLIAHASKKINIYKSTIKDAESRDKFKLKGDLLMANIYKLKGGESGITVENFYDEALPEVKITLDPQKTPSQNAQRLYAKYTKLKTAGEVAAEMLEKTEEELTYLLSVQQFISEIKTSSDLSQIKEELREGGYIKKSKGRQKPQKAKPMELESSDGFKILVGKNNIQNDYVTFKLSRSRDIWLHTKNIPGSHTLIVRGNAEEIPDSTIIEAANICAAHSKAKDGVKVPVDYTEIKNVKKIAGAKPGMVIYDNYNTVYVTPSDKK